MNEEKSTCVRPRQTVEGQEKDTHHQRAGGQSGENGKGKAIKVAEGMTFGAWRVLSLGEPSISMRGNKTIRWMCKCECGTEKLIHVGNLWRGLSTSCGCRDHRFDRSQ